MPNGGTASNQNKSNQALDKFRKSAFNFKDAGPAMQKRRAAMMTQAIADLPDADYKKFVIAANKAKKQGQNTVNFGGVTNFPIGEINLGRAKIAHNRALQTQRAQTAAGFTAPASAAAPVASQTKDDAKKKVSKELDKLKKQESSVKDIKNKVSNISERFPRAKLYPEMMGHFDEQSKSLADKKKQLQQLQKNLDAEDADVEDITSKISKLSKDIDKQSKSFGKKTDSYISRMEKSADLVREVGAEELAEDIDALRKDTSQTTGDEEVEEAEEEELEEPAEEVEEETPATIREEAPPTVREEAPPTVKEEAPPTVVEPKPTSTAPDTSEIDEGWEEPASTSAPDEDLAKYQEILDEIKTASENPNLTPEQADALLAKFKAVRKDYNTALKKHLDVKIQRREAFGKTMRPDDSRRKNKYDIDAMVAKQDPVYLESKAKTDKVTEVMNSAMEAIGSGTSKVLADKYWQMQGKSTPTQLQEYDKKVLSQLEAAEKTEKNPSYYQDPLQDKLPTENGRSIEDEIKKYCKDNNLDYSQIESNINDFREQYYQAKMDALTKDGSYGRIHNGKVTSIGYMYDEKGQETPFHITGYDFANAEKRGAMIQQAVNNFFANKPKPNVIPSKPPKSSTSSQAVAAAAAGLAAGAAGVAAGAAGAGAAGAAATGAVLPAGAPRPRAAGAPAQAKAGPVPSGAPAIPATGPGIQKQTTTDKSRGGQRRADFQIKQDQTAAVQAGEQVSTKVQSTQGARIAAASPTGAAAPAPAATRPSPDAKAQAKASRQAAVKKYGVTGAKQAAPATGTQVIEQEISEAPQAPAVAAGIAAGLSPEQAAMAALAQTGPQMAKQRPKPTGTAAASALRKKPQVQEKSIGPQAVGPGRPPLDAAMQLGARQQQARRAQPGGGGATGGDLTREQMLEQAGSGSMESALLPGMYDALARQGAYGQAARAPGTAAEQEAVKSDFERQSELMSRQRQMMRTRNMLVGQAGLPGQEQAAGPVPAEAEEEPGSMPSAGQDFASADEEFADEETPEKEESAETEQQTVLAGLLQAQIRRAALAASATEQKETAIESAKNATESAKKTFSRLLKIGQAFSSVSGLTLLSCLAQLNIEVINKYTFKTPLIAKTNRLEDGIAVCGNIAACGIGCTSMCMSPLFVVPLILSIIAGMGLLTILGLMFDFFSFSDILKAIIS
ncbi:MAG: hypothetical protein ACOYUZ_03140 [Patescibacteria group bacterium]